MSVRRPLVESLYTKGKGTPEARNPPRNSLRIALTALTPEQEVEARVFADAISRASTDDLLALARLLVRKPSHQVFGQTELQLRDLVHRSAAKALDLYLAEKTTVANLATSLGRARASRLPEARGSTGEQFCL